MKRSTKLDVVAMRRSGGVGAVVVCLALLAVAPRSIGALDRAWRAELELPDAESVVTGPAGWIFSATSKNRFSQTLGKNRSAIYAHDGSGELLWSANAKGRWTRRLALSPDGLTVVAAGLADTRVWLAGYDAATGERQWERRFLPEGLSGTPRVELSVAPDGAILVTGITATGTGLGGYFVSRLDSDGVVVWTRLYGQPADGERLLALGIAADPRGKGYYVAGVDDQLRDTTTDFFFLARHDDDGEITWNRVFGQKTRAAFPTALMVSPNGRTVYVAGEADQAFFVRRFTSRGKVKWSRSLRLAQGAVDVRDVALAANGKHFRFTGNFSTEDGIRGLAVTTNNRVKKATIVLSDGDPRFWDDYARVASTDDGFVVLEASSLDPPARRPVRLTRHVQTARAGTWR